MALAPRTKSLENEMCPSLSRTCEPAAPVLNCDGGIGESIGLTLSDDVLKATGMNEREALLEIARRLFRAEKLSLWAAAKMAGLSRTEFEQELLKRRIPLYRPTPEDLRTDLETLYCLDRDKRGFRSRDTPRDACGRE